MSNECEAVPNILYHYTSIDAFRNIMESKTMRATRYDQMNDTSEVQIGIEKLRDAVRNYKIDKSFRDYKKFLIKGIEGYKEDTLDVYVLSLSSVADSLDQWRAYAPNGGVAIGFDRKMVKKGFLTDITPKVGGRKIDSPIRPNPSNSLMCCIYTDKNGNLDLRSVVAERFFKQNSYAEMFKRQEPIVQSIFMASLSVMIYQTICSIKHGAYAPEMEWRCVNYRPDPKDYPIQLSDRNRLYIEMKFDPKEYVKEVWISPHGDKEAYESVVTYFKRKSNLCFIIKKSKIPFRK